MHPKVENWRKKPVILELDEANHLPKFHISDEDFGLYESLCMDIFTYPSDGILTKFSENEETSGAAILPEGS